VKKDLLKENGQVKDLIVDERCNKVARQERRRKPPKVVGEQKGDKVFFRPQKGMSPKEFFERMAEVTGVVEPSLHVKLMNQIANTSPDTEGRAVEAVNDGLALLHGINPQNAIEGMLAVQMVGTHNIALEMMRRAIIKGQSSEEVNRKINLSTKLLRTFTSQVEALQKMRNRGQQTVRVEHVTVNAGGQAIVGNVKNGAGGGEGADEN
jgi:hypothetical protein